jgi:hypothetical protein
LQEVEEVIILVPQMFACSFNVSVMRQHNMG